MSNAFSVIIRVKNEERWVGHAIQSTLDFLDGPQIVVVDNKSTDESIDIVDIFRPSDEVLPFVQDAIKKKPKVIWLQEGIHNQEAEELARNQGIKVVFNRCMLAEHQRLF